MDLVPLARAAIDKAVHQTDELYEAAMSATLPKKE